VHINIIAFLPAMLSFAI